jgi:mannose-6-phosphate isomerase-like protein (cupin superfamily)
MTNAPARSFIIIMISLSAFFSPAAWAQEKLTVEPDPSYNEGGPATRRHPEVDTNVDLYINHWQNSLPREGHGGLIERDILSPGDPYRPAEKGAVLKYIKAYKRAVLQARTNTVATRQDREQAFFYVCSGHGKVEAGGKAADLEEGTGIFVPAGLEYRFFNPHETDLEMIVVVEGTADGFVPGRHISVGSYHASQPIVGGHWAHITHPFVFDVEPKFSNPMGFIVVSIDNFDIAQPHTHPPGTEEIWLQLRGRSLLFFGNRLLWQRPGEAFLVPPTNKVPHCSINPTAEPMLWLFMGCRHPEDATRRGERS